MTAEVSSERRAGINFFNCQEAWLMSRHENFGCSLIPHPITVESEGSQGFLTKKVIIPNIGCSSSDCRLEGKYQSPLKSFSFKVLTPEHVP